MFQPWSPTPSESQALFDAKSLLDFFRRHTLRFRHDARHPKPLQYHHGRMESECMPAGNFRHDGEGPGDQGSADPVGKAAQRLTASPATARESFAEEDGSLAPALPSRSTRSSPLTPQQIWPLAMNANPPNIFRSVIPPRCMSKGRVRAARASL